MNIEHLRKTLKAQWLNYYRENRSWLTRLGMWVNCDGKRRPSSSFILGTLATLEPQLVQILPLVVDLSSNPDRIILALGLNFNPDEELEAIAELDRSSTRSLPASKVAALTNSPNSQSKVSVVSQSNAQLEGASELRSAKTSAQTSAQTSTPSSTQSTGDAPPSRSPKSDPPATQVTVAVRKIIDPPEPSVAASTSRAKSETEAKTGARAEAKIGAKTGAKTGKPETGKPETGKPETGANPETGGKPDAAKSGVPNYVPTEMPSRFPANGTPDNRPANRRLPLDTAILSAGQLPDRDTTDPDTPSTLQSSTVPNPDDARP